MHELHTWAASVDDPSTLSLVARRELLDRGWAEDQDREAIAEAIDQEISKTRYQFGSVRIGRTSAQSLKPAEFEILLSTGGPATRIVGELNQYKEPTWPRHNIRGWFKPWTEYLDATSAQDEALDWYLGQFYFESNDPAIATALLSSSAGFFLLSSTSTDRSEPTATAYRRGLLSIKTIRRPCWNPWRQHNRITDTKLAKLQLAFDSLREMDREIPGQVVSAFLFIASHDGCHLQALTDELGLQTASRSRVTDWLSDYHRLGKPGLGLITKTKTQPTAGGFCGLPTKGRPWPINSRRPQVILNP